MTPQTNADESQSLAELAIAHPGAARVFHRHGLDFCCHGGVTLTEACARKGLDPGAVVAEVAAQSRVPTETQRWDTRPIPVLIDYILDRFHAGHRPELVRLRQMAERVEKVHAEKTSCPRGLADHIEHLAFDLENHMQKEEKVLFPLLATGRGGMAATPIKVMEQEHEDHGRNLERLRLLAHDFAPPLDACGTWRTLYLGLAEFEREVMEHIHLENNVLFPRVLRARA